MSSTYLQQTFTVWWLSVALLLVRQEPGEFVASAWCRLARLSLWFTTVARWVAKTLRTRHGDLKLLQDLRITVRGAGGVVATVTVHWMERSHRKTGIDKGERQKAGWRRNLHRLHEKNQTEVKHHFSVNGPENKTFKEPLSLPNVSCCNICPTHFDLIQVKVNQAQKKNKPKIHNLFGQKITKRQS